MLYKKSGKKEIINIILLFVCSIFITCLFLEIVLRIAGYNPLKHELAGRENILRKSPFPEMAYEGFPNSEGYVWGAHIKINSLGFRDKEYDLKKNSGTFRIAVLGDSITFGNMLSIEDVYTEQLENLFSKKKKDVEVLNLGMTGYDTLAEVSSLEHIGLRFNPDLVVIGFCVNDIAISGNLAEIVRTEKYSSYLYRSRLVQFISGKIDRLKEILNIKKLNTEESFISKYREHMSDISNDSELIKMEENLKMLLKEHGNNDNFLIELYTSTNHLRKLRYSLERLKQLNDKYGFNVIVMIISYLKEDEKSKKKYQIIYNIVKHESDRLGFDVVNTHDTFQAAGFNNLLRAENDAIHPNELGHKIMAALLYERINSRFLPDYYGSK
jgi:lysophospholipase L1-like esterase